MYVTPDKKFLVFELQDGWRYEDKVPVGGKDEHEQIRLGFKYWKKVFDLSDFKLPNTDENYFKNLREVMSVGQIITQRDTTLMSIRKLNESTKDLLKSGVWMLRSQSSKNKTTTLGNHDTPKPFWEYVPDSLRSRVLSSSEISIRSVKSMIEINKQNYKLHRLNLIDAEIELHKRFTMPFACILLFIIGAALGSIIRKGGLGMPFVSAVVFFIIYYFMNTIGEKIAKEDVVSVVVGMWSPSLILLLIGVFLLYKANNDSPLFNKEIYTRFFEAPIQMLNRLGNAISRGFNRIGI
jgi:lipopolysaccharide export system permease protein